MREPEHTIIVGGGFSGVALAAELVRRETPARITLLESGPRLGRGLAYGTPHAAHVLNTRADQMSLFADDPGHFERWRRRHGAPIHGAEFALRRDYGEYLEESLLAACTASPRASVVVELETRATDLVRTAHGLELSLADGRTLRADEVVLATGHPAPADPFGGTLSSARYLRDPWRHDDFARIAADESVLLLGTGLTAIDVVLALEQQGHHAPIHALSRRGLLPRAHRARRESLPADLHAALQTGVALNGLRGVTAAVRRVAAAAEERGIGWQPVFDALRPLAPRIWSSLCAADRQRFVRWLRPYWDVHRHRLPPAQAGRVAALRARGRLSIRAGRLRAGVDEGASIVVDHVARGDGRRIRERYDWVVNCTGSSFAKADSRPFERRLLERGLLLPDPLGLGYVADDLGRVLGACGPIDGLYLLGPACRPSCWEHTAVPELRAQAVNVAADLAVRRTRSRPVVRAPELRVAAQR